MKRLLIAASVILGIAAGSHAQLINSKQLSMVGGPAPTAAGSGGTCATGTVVGNPSAGIVTLAVACAATDTITLSILPPMPHGYSCFASDQTQPATLVYQTSSTTTTAVFTVSGTTSGETDVIQYVCGGY